MNAQLLIRQRIMESIEIKAKIANDQTVLKMVEDGAGEIAKALNKGGKVLICGNGGSASDAIHFSAELVGRFQKERRPVPAIALNADVATLTAVANDYGYEKTFERAVQAYMTPDDILVGISTSGNSENVYRAIIAAKEIGGKTIGLLGKDGGKIAKTVDIPLIIPCNITARVQECHILLIHTICELVEQTL